MSEKKDNLDIENELDNMKNIFTPLNDKISPPYSVTPAVIEGTLDETKAHKTIFTTPFFKKYARNFFATAITLAIVATSVGTYWITSKRPLLIKEANDISVVSTTANSTTAKQAEVTKATQKVVKVKEVSDKNVTIVNDYTKIYKVLKQYKNNYSSRVYYAGKGNGTTVAAGTVAAAQDNALAGAPEANTAEAAHGTTNTQVAEVDEGDIVKNDGEYLYFLSHANSINSLKIIKADENGIMQLISSLKIEEGFYPQELYILDSQVILVGSKQEKIEQPPVTTSKNTTSSTTATATSKEVSGSSGSSGSAVAPDAIAPDYYYGYWNMSTYAVVYDVSDKTKPRQIHSFCQDGSYVSSRLVAGKLYIVTNHYITSDLSKITEKNVTNYVPTICVDKGKDVPMAAADIAIVNDGNSPNYAVVSGLDLKNFTNKIASQAVLGSGDTIYSTTENLYIACYRYKQTTANDTKSFAPSSSYTSVLKFSFIDQDIKFTGSGDVNGNILNKYSMDETNGYFRIATTQRTYDNGFSISNSVYVLNKNLEVAGKVENIAEGETIKSVRFMGKMVYVVTFRQTDPLFAIDLSNPTAPKILGELKIPGFSAYLHPISDKYLLGIGVNGDENGSTGGVKLSLFDVSDPKNPKEAFKYVLPGNQSYTAVANDPKAFMYDKENGILALPVNLGEYDYSKNINNRLSVLSLFKVDTAKGFTPLFDITNSVPVKNKINTYYLRQTGDVLRGTYIGNTIFSISENNIISANINTEKRIDVLNLTDDKNNDVYRTTVGLSGMKFISPDPEILVISKNIPVDYGMID